MASVEQQRTSGSYDVPEEDEQQRTRSRQLTGFSASTEGATERAAAFAPKVEQAAALVRAKKTFKKLHTSTTEVSTCPCLGCGACGRAESMLVERALRAAGGVR